VPIDYDDTLLTGDNITDYKTQQFFRAYIRMAREARIRMQAPSDGLGTVMLTDEELTDPLVLRNEAMEYASEMVAADEKTHYELFGCTHGPWTQAFAFTLQAAELMFSGAGAEPTISRLLQMALDEMRSS
jgi:hypothetical protein